MIAIINLQSLLGISDDAEIAVFESLGSTLIAAANMAHLKQIAQGKGPNESLTINGETINMINGYPTDDSIGLINRSRGVYLST